MLDEGFHVRLGDFGLANLMNHDKSPVSTFTVGTMGYFAPEYLKYGKATDKTDVFIYRVVILKWLVEEGQLRENQIFSKW